MTNQVTVNGIPAIENLQQEDGKRKKSSSFQITRVITKMTDDNETDSLGYDNDDDDDDDDSDSDLNEKDEKDYMSTYHENGNIISFPLVNQQENIQHMTQAALVNSINIPRSNISSQFHSINQQLHNTLNINQFPDNSVVQQTSQIVPNNVHNSSTILRSSQTQPIHQNQVQQSLIQPLNPSNNNGNTLQTTLNVASLSHSDISLSSVSSNSQSSSKSIQPDASKSTHNFTKVKLNCQTSVKDSKPVHLCEPSRFKVVKASNYYLNTIFYIYLYK